MSAAKKKSKAPKEAPAKKGGKSAAKSADKSADKSASKAERRKEAQLLVRVDKALRDDFVEACRVRDTSASRELRRFMREYLAASRA